MSLRRSILVGTAVGTAAFFGPGIVLGACGFTPAGVTAGSIAAVWQSGIGNVAAGSIFAACQSLAATGVGIKTAGCSGIAAAALSSKKIRVKSLWKRPK